MFRVRFDVGAVNDNGKLAGAPEIKPSTALPRFIRDEPQLASTFDAPLDANGLTIEGVAVREGRLYAGMRGPVLANGDAVILSVPLVALFDGQTGAQQLHVLNLGRDTRGHARGVRDLVTFENGFFVLAGPRDDPDDGQVKDHDYAVFWWDGKNISQEPSGLRGYGSKVKPEALVPLEQRGNKLRVLLFFDGPDEGGPQPDEIKQPGSSGGFGFVNLGFAQDTCNVVPLSHSSKKVSVRGHILYTLLRLEKQCGVVRPPGRPFSGHRAWSLEPWPLSNAQPTRDSKPR